MPCSHLVPDGHAKLDVGVDERAPRAGGGERGHEIQKMAPGVPLLHPTTQVPIARHVGHQCLGAVAILVAKLAVEGRECDAGVHQLQYACHSTCNLRNLTSWLPTVHSWSRSPCLGAVWQTEKRPGDVKQAKFHDTPGQHLTSLPSRSDILLHVVDLAPLK
jgi:hypothetical protein